MTTTYDPSPARFLRTVDLAAIGLGFLIAGDPAPSCYQPHEPVADDDPVLPPMQYDAVVAQLGWDPLHVCPEHRDRCAGAECCCRDEHRVSA